jgi:hypothetical protein
VYSSHNGKSNKDIDWARFGLGKREASLQQQQLSDSNRSDRLPGATGFGYEYHYGPGGHEASEVNELFAEEQVLKVIINFACLLSATWKNFSSGQVVVYAVSCPTQF